MQYKDVQAFDYIYYFLFIDMQVTNIRNLVLKQLLFELNEQYENNTFQINTSLRHAVETIFEHQPDLHIHVDEQELNNIRMEINMFVFGLIKAPSTWVDLLRNDQISSRTPAIPINTPETLTQVYKEIILQTNQLINQNYDKNKDQPNQTKKGFDFQKQYMDEATKLMLAYLLNNLAQQICKFFQKGKKILLKQQQKIEEELKKSEIMNAYFLFGILKQMSTRTYEKIEQEMGLYFKYLPAETTTKFCRYVQKNFEFVDLVCSESVVKIYTDQEMRQSIDLQNQFWLNLLKNCEDKKFTVKKLTSEKGDSAVMLIPTKLEDENSQSFNEAQRLIMKIGEKNKIYVTSLQASQKKWEIFNMKDSVSGFYKIMKNYLLDANSTGSIEKDIVAYGVPIGQYANLGGSLGKSIANINKYKSANQFFKDLSKNTIIGGSMTYIFKLVPIMTYFAIAGGLTYTFYLTYKNRATSNLKKATQVGKTTVTAVSSFGSAMAGMMLGQTLVPVPFLGAFVGGLIGGFLGQTGATLMTTLMNKESYKNLINYLKVQFIDQRYWQYSLNMLKKLGINPKYFQSSVCPDENKRDVYVTAICFCIVSSYEAQRYILRNKQKMKELEREQKKQKKNEAQLVMQEQNFQNQFNIVGIVDYLTEKNLNLEEQREKLSKCIQHISL